MTWKYMDFHMVHFYENSYKVMSMNKKGEDKIIKIDMCCYLLHFTSYFYVKTAIFSDVTIWFNLSISYLLIISMPFSSRLKLLFNIRVRKDSFWGSRIKSNPEPFSSDSWQWLRYSFSNHFKPYYFSDAVIIHRYQYRTIW